MAEASLPRGGARTSWLDRPLLPTWQRLAGLLAHWEVAAYAALVLVAFLLRVWDVGGRAMHHDESLHAFYAWKFFVGQGYSYDPLMHGPLQFEVVPLFYLIFGDSETSARLLAVLLGTTLVALPFFLRSYLTRPGALLTALMLAISPSLVYFSRFIRDDIYLACFSLLLFLCLVKYLEAQRPRYLYLAAAAAALALGSMEAAYITFFIFGTFLLFQALKEYLGERTGPVLRAVKATSLDTWLTAASIFVVVTVLMYSTFFTNPDGIWDSHHSLTSPLRQDILGGLTYWKLQHTVQRGGQPWFYYLLVLPLYEQLALVFGIAGGVYAILRRSLVTTFLVWWALMSFGLYSWAGEKMPWLTIHITVPLILLAGLALGKVLQSGRTWLMAGSTGLFTLLLILETHSTFVLNYIDGANPTELLIYVQTSPDVPRVVHEIAAISQRETHGTALPIGLDNVDVGGWPFTWYLRDYPNVVQTSTFSTPLCSGKPCPVLLMLGPEYAAQSSRLLKTYVAQQYRWNWWFPEDYKTWFPDHWTALLQTLQGKSQPGVNALPTGGDISNVWNWLVYRRPFGERGARLLYLLVRRDLVPHAQYFSKTSTSTVVAAAPQGPLLPATLTGAFGATGAGRLGAPHGLAVAPDGTLFAADPLNHRVVAFSRSGVYLRAFGRVGTGPGHFSQRDSPQGVAVGPDGKVYVADTWNQRVEVFDAQGRFVRSWGGGPVGAGPGQFYGPRSIAVSASGRVYVADTGNKRIQVFSPTGHYLFSWGTGGTAPGQFQEPSSVAIGPGGRVYVADYWNQRIQSFTSTGSFLQSWPVSSWVPQSYDEPYLAVDQHTGTVYSAEPAAGEVIAYARNGRLLGSFATKSLTLPIGMAVEPGGRVAVGDITGGRVGIFRPDLTAPRYVTPHSSPTRERPKQP